MAVRVLRTPTPRVCHPSGSPGCASHGFVCSLHAGIFYLLLQEKAKSTGSTSVRMCPCGVTAPKRSSRAAGMGFLCIPKAEESPATLLVGGGGRKAAVSTKHRSPHALLQHPSISSSGNILGWVPPCLHAEPHCAALCWTLLGLALIQTQPLPFAPRSQIGSP